MLTARFTLRLVVFGMAVVLAWAAWQLYQQTLALRYHPVASSPTQPSKLPSQVTVLPADPVRGLAAAPVTLVLFSDFECPYCAQVAPILARAVAGSSGKFRLVWKDFPLPTHAQALPAAEAAQCAGAQGKFWEYHDRLFERQAELGPALYQGLATELHLALEPFQRCLAQHILKPLIERGLEEGTAIGVDSTPFLVVGNRVYRGTFTADELNQFIQP